MRVLLLALGVLFVSVVVLPLLSVALGRVLVDDGIDSFRGDPVAYAVARNAHVLADAHRDNLIQRLIAPAGRVIAVTFEPGHCAQPPGSNRLREYTAQVRFHTFFGYPVEDVYVECGGESARGAP
ncbi:MAG: hypothetical protein JNJ67_04620, partial [Chromatiales bacterium]|nr:hypothetical protein [Chromatiales bacterium]